MSPQTRPKIIYNTYNDTSLFHLFYYGGSLTYSSNQHIFYTTSTNGSSWNTPSEVSNNVDGTITRIGFGDMLVSNGYLYVVYSYYNTQSNGYALAYTYNEI